MANQSIPVAALFGGVSRQPANQRHENQVEEGENALFNVVNGFEKRPGTRVLKHITGLTAGANYRVHTIDRDENEQYLVIYGDVAGTMTIRVFNALTGDEATVNVTTNAQTYLDANSPTANDIVMATNVDYTMIANRTVACATRNNEKDIDETLAPISMVRTTTSPLVFDIDTTVYESRGSGNKNNNPAPSIFTDGRKVSDITFFRNRFWILGDENLVGSQASDLFNFYIDSVSSVVDSDPIDLLLSTDSVTVCDRVTMFRNTLVIFTKSGKQFELSSPTTLSPSTASVSQTTAYYSELGVKPARMGSAVYFASGNDDTGILYEYIYTEIEATNIAANVTRHVAGYIPAGIKTVVASANNNTVILVPATAGNECYVYRAYWQNDTKVQSAWSKFTTGDDDVITDIGVIRNDAFMLVELDGGDFIVERLPLSTDAADSDMPSTVHLDRQQRITGSYDSATNRTTLDYVFDDTTQNVAVITGDFSAENVGGTLNAERVTDHSIKVVGDWSAGDLIVGRAYDMDVTLSRPYAKDRNNVPIIDGRLQIRKLITSHRNTAHYKVVISNPPRSDKEKALTRFQVGVDEIGGFPIDEEGQLATLVRGSADNATVRVVNSSPYPSIITSIEWLAELTRRVL